VRATICRRLLISKIAKEIHSILVRKGQPSPLYLVIAELMKNTPTAREIISKNAGLHGDGYFAKDFVRKFLKDEVNIRDEHGCCPVLELIAHESADL
jgi:hypothetical protein